MILRQVRNTLEVYFDNGDLMVLPTEGVSVDYMWLRFYRRCTEYGITADDIRQAYYNAPPGPPDIPYASMLEMDSKKYFCFPGSVIKPGDKFLTNRHTGLLIGTVSGIKAGPDILFSDEYPTWAYYRHHCIRLEVRSL